MAVFILQNDSRRRDNKNLRRRMEYKGHSLSEYLSLNGKQLSVFQSSTDHRKWKFEYRGNQFFLFGTLVYKREYSGPAAIQLLDDLNSANLDAEQLNGSFCLIYQSEKGLSIILDQQGIYQLYSNESYGLISNSFLAAHSMTDSPQPDLMAIQANLILGYIPYPDTQFNQIKRIQKDNTFQDISLERYGLNSSPPKLKTYFDHLEYQASRLTDYRDNVKDFLTDQGMEIGVSGGYDSRLILALFQNTDVPIHAHTHHKKNDPDPIIARRICELLGLELEENRERLRLETEHHYQNLMESSMLQFDGRICSMMQYAKYEYTREYRNKVLKPGYCIVSGVGGEIYRNHNYFNPGLISLDLWIRYYLINHQVWESIKHEGREEFLEYLKSFLTREMGDLKKVNYFVSKRYYKDIWLRDWHGLRNSAENQYNYHLSPFADHTLANPSIFSSKHHKSLGKFEIDLIGEFCKPLLAIDSVYGFSFDNLPLKERIMESIKISIPVGLKFYLGKQLAKSKRLRFVSSQNPIVRQNLEALKALGLKLDLDQFTASQDRFDLANSIGFALRNLT